MDPKTSLAVDAPPVAPYDDGFSTESEDLNDPEELTQEEQDSQLHIDAFRSVRSAAVVENQSHVQQQQLLDLAAANSNNFNHQKNRRTTATPTLKSGENPAKQAAIDQKLPRNGHVTAREEVEIIGLKSEGEHCRSCKGYLTPLVERIKMMKAATLRCNGEEPPSTKQCSCCHITYPVLALTDESRYAEPRCYMCNWAARAVKNIQTVDVKRTRSEDVKVTHVNRAAVDEKEGCCRRCKVTLTPLARRLRVMKETVLHHKKRGPPPTKQCSCCHITYPMAALTLTSREPGCRAPICFLCRSASMEAKTPLTIAGTTAVNTDLSKLRENGTEATSRNTAANIASTIVVKTESSALRQNGAVATSRSAAAKGTHEEEEKETDGGCRKCKRKLPTVDERRRMMKATLQHIKEDGRNGNRPLRKCSCCRIMYPLSSLTEKSRNIKCTTPICYTCADQEAPSSSDTVGASNFVDEKSEVLRETKKKEVAVVNGEGNNDEKGELMEEHICKCCSGQLTTLVDRLKMMKDAALQHGGKGPPSSRQCACCRITYPSAALTANSRKSTRVVPICLKCCRAGGSAIYEMLAASDEFIEAFKVENPEMAHLLQKKKESGKLAKTAENQRNRVIMQRQPKKALRATITVQVPRPSDPVTPAENRRSFIPFSSYVPYGVKMNRKPIRAPASSYYANAALQARLHTEQKTGTEQKPTTQQASAQRPRSSRWLQQFEIIDGKTARERRLEARIATQERRLENKRQRMK